MQALETLTFVHFDPFTGRSLAVDVLSSFPEQTECHANLWLQAYLLTVSRE